MEMESLDGNLSKFESTSRRLDAILCFFSDSVDLIVRHQQHGLAYTFSTLYNVREKLPFPLSEKKRLSSYRLYNSQNTLMSRV